MSDVLLTEEHTNTEKGHVTTEAEIGTIQRHAMESQGLTAATRS